MRVSSFWAKFKTLCLTILAIVVVIGLILTDYFFRHEVTGQARRDLKSSGFQLGATGIIKAIQLDQLSKLEIFDTAKVSFSSADETGMTPLNFAIESQNSSAIGALLDRKRSLKPSVDMPCKDGYTPLNRALRQRKYELADKLIELGADINREKETGMPWLIDAINQKDDQLRDYLLAKNIDINKKGAQSFFPVALAARDNNLELMQKLAAQGGNLKIKGVSGNTLLVEAIVNEDRNEIDFLLKQKLDANEKGSHPYPPLAIAAQNNDVDLMAKLINAGATINIKGTTGEDLFIESFLENSYKEVDLLLKSGADPNRKVGNHDPLLIALQRQDGYLRSMLVENGVSLDRNGFNKRHLVFEAQDSKDHDWMMQLIENGISPNKQSAKGETLLLNAIAERDYQAVDFLIGKGADINKKNKQGDSPIKYAVANSDLAMIRLLIQHKVNINWSEMAAIAFKNRDTPTLNVLINAGMSPEVKLPKQNLRLFDAAMAEGSVETARLLLNEGVKLGDNFWRALENNMDEVAELCLLAGHDPRAKGPDGRTPMRYVLDQSKYGLIEPLLKAGAHEAVAIHPQESWLGRLIRNGDSEIALGLMNGMDKLGDGRAGDGHTLLSWAIAQGMNDVAIELIERGIDMNVNETSPASDEFMAKFKDVTRFQYYLKVDPKVTPIMVASAKQNHQVAQKMMKSGARSTRSADGLYPVSIAAWFHDTRMMQILFGRNPDYQPRKLIVDLSQQRVVYYINGQPSHSSSISSGKPGYRTPTGTYVITQKNKDHVSNLYDAEMPYFMRLSCGDFGFHTGDIPGYPASHGCIRLPDSTAKKYFYECELGDLVIIY